MSNRDPSSRIGGALAWANVDAILAVEEVTLWNAFGMARCREGCLGLDG
jgi:hypothetical protein